MATVTSNVDELIAKLETLARGPDFSEPGLRGAGTVADDLREIYVFGVMARCAAQTDPAGNAWADNSDTPPWRYKTRKAGRPVGIGLDKKGHRGGLMLSQVQLMGRMTVTPEEITLAYGVDPVAIREIQWFSKGSHGTGPGENSGAKNQPERHVWGFDPQIVAETMAYLDEYVKVLIA